MKQRRSHTPGVEYLEAARSRDPLLTRLGRTPAHFTAWVDRLIVRAATTTAQDLRAERRAAVEETRQTLRSFWGDTARSTHAPLLLLLAVTLASRPHAAPWTGWVLLAASAYWVAVLTMSVARAIRRRLWR